MLESGIAFPLIDSALVWSHPDLFRPEKLDSAVRFRMAAGANYAARYKLAPGLSVNGSRSLCDAYVVDMGGHKGDLLWPLNRFTTDSAAAPAFSDSTSPGGVWNCSRRRNCPVTAGRPMP